MEKYKQVQTVDNLEYQISKISSNLGDISPISLKNEAERIQSKKRQKKFFLTSIKNIIPKINKATRIPISIRMPTVQLKTRWFLI